MTIGRSGLRQKAALLPHAHGRTPINIVEIQMSYNMHQHDKSISDDYYDHGFRIRLTLGYTPALVNQGDADKYIIRAS